ncbi:hypothetical protein FDP41_007587 [Naegleria fowleri]|uniref:Metallo-beta-lactamase domain-containing protein n=1 Tax=Naegleria fowleri TaxID=5763 RepID=A0A6A5C9M7_NAEFO|nr:uncharacterized protein FDP41_007587 [Naegleria fowleri]KAF0983672.1 hypothetical protein FDP41_007587 [Naegleria fowleri]
MKVIPNIFELPQQLAAGEEITGDDVEKSESSASTPSNTETPTSTTTTTAGAITTKSSSSSTSSSITSPGNLQPLSLIGHSRSAEATYFQIPQLSTNIDMGFIDKKYMNQHPNTFLITHTHADHSYYLSACQPAFINRKVPNRVFVPKENVKFVENFLHACQELNAGKELPRESVQERKPVQVIGVSPGDVIEKIGGKENFVARVVRCDHSIVCNGYAIYEKKKKLKKEFSHLKGAEIGKMRKELGEDAVCDTIFEPRIAIMGDTTYRVFEMNPELLEFPAIVVECTFLEEGQEEQALGAYHMHWNHLKPIVEKYSNIHFILTHFSLRYTDEFILDFFAKQNVKNVTPLVDDKF